MLVQVLELYWSTILKYQCAHMNMYSSYYCHEKLKKLNDTLF